MTKNREKSLKNIFGSELSETNNEPTFRFLNFWHQNMTRKKWRKIIFGSELSEPNNEPTLRLHQKSWQKIKKNRKIIFGSELSEANNEPTFRLHQKNWQKNREKKIEKLFLGQNCLKRIMILDYTKNDKKSRIVWSK